MFQLLARMNQFAAARQTNRAKIQSSFFFPSLPATSITTTATTGSYVTTTQLYNNAAATADADADAVESVPKLPIITQIASKNAPAAIGPYSQGVAFNDMVFTSGCVGMSPDTGEMESGVEDQTHMAIANLKYILEAGNSSMDHVLKTTIYLANIADYAKVNAIYSQYFTGEIKPARSTVQVAELPKRAKIEIDAIAVAKNNK